MKRATFICALLAATLAAGTASTASGAAPAPRQRPAVFLERVIGAIAANDYDDAWQTLHPAHQAVAPEEEYLACEQLTPISVTLASLVPVSSRRKRIAVAGLRGKSPGVVVTFRLRWADEAGATSTTTLTAAAVSLGDHWAWMLPRARYELYRDDACGL